MPKALALFKKIGFPALLVCIGMVHHVPRAEAQPAEKPNIVILFADDLGYGDLSSYGHPTIRTPNLDQMAREGMRLTSFYAAAPVCTPSRAALLTGRYPIRSGMTQVLYPNAEGGLPPSEVTLAEALKEEGYRTMAIGKWHLGDREIYLPTEHGFDAYYGLPYSNDMIPPWVETDVPLRLYRNGEPIPQEVDQDTLTTSYTEEAVKFIRSAAGEPFFLYLPYSMPHLPIYTAERFRGTSSAGLYGDVIQTIDWSAGRIMETLEAEGVAENTIVVFTSDNGPWSNMPERMQQGGVERWHAGTSGLLRGAKITTWEGGMRVPSIVRWPREIPAGQTSAGIATTMDLYVTLIEAAGGEVPQDRPVDGHDLLPFLKGEADSPTETFYYYRGEEVQAVREGVWKFFRETEDTAQALYHLERDPSEQYDVADDHPEVVERLQEKVNAQANESAQ